LNKAESSNDDECGKVIAESKKARFLWRFLEMVGFWIRFNLNWEALAS